MIEPVVFLPGMMCDARIFAPQINALSQERAVTVAPITGGERIEEIASGILEQLPQRFAIAGQGMGGIVAMELLRRAPERILRIALIDTTPLADTPPEAAAREPRIISAKAGRFHDAVREEIKPAYLAAGPGRISVMTQVLAMADSLGPEVFVRQSRAMQRRRDQQGTLRKCKVPTLVMCGAEDGLYPVKRHAFLTELAPYAALHVIPDAGHLPSLEQPDATTDALRDWLGQPLVLK